MDRLACQNTGFCGGRSQRGDPCPHPPPPGCWRHLPQAFLLFLTQEQVAKGILLCWDTTAGKQSTFRGEEDFSFSLGRKHPERTNTIPNARQMPSCLFRVTVRSLPLVRVSSSVRAIGCQDSREVSEYGGRLSPRQPEQPPFLCANPSPPGCYGSMGRGLGPCHPPPPWEPFTAYCHSHKKYSSGPDRHSSFSSFPVTQRDQAGKSTQGLPTGWGSSEGKR